MKIIIIQDGSDTNFFCCMSLLIGLSKKYFNSQILWIGNSYFFKVLKFNKRIADTIDIESDLNFALLNKIYECDICINTSLSKASNNIVKHIKSHKYYGFLDEPTDKKAMFLKNILSNKTRTNKHILDIYYSMCDMKWSGEGFGLSYYPRIKQTEICGICLSNKNNKDEKYKECQFFDLPTDILKRFDIINKYKQIVTDIEFVAFAAISLKKNVIYKTAPLPYNIQFFGKGKLELIDV